MPATLDYEIAGERYQSSKLNAFTQLHVLRKLGPVLAKIGPAFMMIATQPRLVMNADGSVATNDDGSPRTVEPNILDDIGAIGPALEALSEMSEADCEYVLQRCLAVTRRFQLGAWAPVFNEQAKRLMFEDMDLPTMLQIARQVLGDSLAGFSRGGAPNSDAPPSHQNAPSNSSGPMKIS